jgi:hypothetical protein
MATQVLTAGTPLAISLPSGTPVSFTGNGTNATQVLMGFTSAGASSGVLVATTNTSAVPVSWTWPGIFINYGSLAIYLVAVSFNVTLTYPS